MLGIHESVLRFADIEVREGEFRLFKSGQVLQIEPKAFRLLLFLLRNPNKLLTKEELLNAVWGDAAVTENSLTRTIAQLRHLLGDDTHNPRYIETVATLGYRFIYPVEVVDDVPATTALPGSPHSRNGAGDTPAIPLLTPAPADPPPTLDKAAPDEKVPAEPPSRQPRILRRLLPLTVLLASCSVTAFWYLHRPLPKAQVTRYTQLTHDGHGKTLGGTDGSRIYFTQASPFVIGQIPVTGGNAAPVQAAEPLGLAQIFDVSPDGVNLLISQRETGELARELWNVQVLGNARHHLGAGVAGGFSPDGNSVTFATAEGDLWIVRSKGTEAHKIAAIGKRVLHLAWSPDGRVIRFSLGGALWEISSDGSNLHKLLPAWQPSSIKCCGSWTPDGKLFLFRSGDSRARGNQIFALDERRSLFRHPPAVPYQLTTGPINWSGPITSRDGKTIFTVGRAYLGELVRLDSQSKQLRPYLKGISAEFLSFSPNGKWLAYVTYPEGILWRANIDGSNPIQLTEPSLDPLNPRWSPDSSRILFGNLVVSSESATAYVVPSDGSGPAQRILPQGPDNQADPGWSPDGLKVVFASGIPRGQKDEHLSMLDLQTGTVTVVPGSEGFRSPRWSRDGRYLMALSYTPPCLRVLDFRTGQWSGLPIQGDVNFPSFSHDGKFIYALDHLGAERFIFRIPVIGGKPQRLFDLKDVKMTGRLTFSLSLDPTDAPLLLRETGSSEIYALTLEQH
jgi:DNA-binding winged helix-turn-helix (wHTH) protein/Tol biopolymer transport system component